MSQAKNKKTSPFAALMTHHSNVIFAGALVLVLATLLIKMPPFMLDIMLACSMSLALVVLIIVLGTNEPLQLITFPSLLLFATLFRLSLNVASTRLILLNGYAGNIINAFGQFVVGGHIVVGMVMFLIIVIIQFIVITKGAGRISEVSARFVLDSMPGKQMAIDADLNAGTITEEQAKERRDKITKESEFYGAMDGASKFISGDAMAGVIITAINLIGGIAMGYTRGMDIATAAKTYCILSIGDGLVSQIPSIVIAISSGFLVTKTSSEKSMGQDLTIQFLEKSEPLKIASLVILAMALVPGFPKIPFIMLGSTGFIISRILRKSEPAKPSAQIESAESSELAEQQAPVEDLLNVDVVSVLVGVRLISMVDPRKQSSIFDRIGALRRKFAQQFGIILPLVRLRDNITLEPNAYEIQLFDHCVAKGTIEPDRFLAMDSGTVTKKVPGMETTEPVYGLPALWVSPKDKETAEVNGYTVIDPESVLITHLSEILQRHAHELLTREDVQQLVERLRKTQPSLVGDVIGELVNIGLLQRVLQNLLKEQIPVRDLTQIIESLGENAGKTKSSILLTELARKAIARTITEQHKSSTGQISAITFDPETEHTIIGSMKNENENFNLALPTEVTMQLTQKVAQAWKNAMDRAYDSVVLLCDARIRYPIYELMKRSVPRLPVLAYDEIAAGTNIEPVETVSLSSADNQQPAAALT